MLIKSSFWQQTTLLFWFEQRPFITIIIKLLNDGLSPAIIRELMWWNPSEKDIQASRGRDIDGDHRDFALSLIIGPLSRFKQNFGSDFKNIIICVSTAAVLLGVQYSKEGWQTRPNHQTIFWRMNQADETDQGKAKMSGWSNTGWKTITDNPVYLKFRL